MPHRVKFSIFDHAGEDSLAEWMQKLTQWLNTNVGFDRWQFGYGMNRLTYPMYLSSDGYKFRLFDYIEFDSQDDMLAFLLTWGGTDE